MRAILDPEQTSTSDRINESYKSLLQLAQILRNANIQDSLARITSTYFLLLDYPNFLKEPNPTTEISHNLNKLFYGKQRIFDQRHEKLSDGYLE